MSGALKRQADAQFVIDDEAVLDKSARAVATGHEGDARQLHEYWTRGEGLAKWAESPHPFASLRAHLARFITDPDELDATTAQWHHDALGFWPGRGHDKALAKSFNPSEARGDHGKWTHVGALISRTVKAGDHKLTLGAHDDGTVSITDRHGHSTRLKAHELKGVRHNLFADVEGDSEHPEHHLRRLESRNGGLQAVPLAHMKRTHVATDAEYPDDDETFGHDRYELRLPADDDASPDDVAAGPGTELSHDDLYRVAQQAENMTGGRRVATGHGDVGFATNGPQVAIVAAGQDPVNLSKRDYQRTEALISAVLHPDDDEDAEKFPDGRITTKAGDIQAVSDGAGGLIVTIGGNPPIHIDAAHVQRFEAAMSGLAD